VCLLPYLNLTEPLGRRNSGSVGRDDLRLVREDIPAAGIDEDLQPVHVIVAVRLVVAERLDARKIFEPATERIQERLVDPEVVRVGEYGVLKNT